MAGKRKRTRKGLERLRREAGRPHPAPTSLERKAQTVARKKLEGMGVNATAVLAAASFGRASFEGATGKLVEAITDALEEVSDADRADRYKAAQRGVARALQDIVRKEG